MIPVQLVPGALELDSLPDQKEVCPHLETSKLMIRQRSGKLFDELDLSGLDSWAPKMANKACQLLSTMMYSHWIRQS